MNQRENKKNSNSKDILSKTLKVALQIYQNQIVLNKPSTISQLFADFDGELNKTSISKALDTLLDLGICKITTQFQKDQESVITVYTIVG